MSCRPRFHYVYMYTYLKRGMIFQIILTSLAQRSVESGDSSRLCFVDVGVLFI